jgi:hypothetical protein
MFIFLDFSLNLGQIRLELIPDFIGFIAMLGGLKDLSGESPAFEAARPFATFMAFYTGIAWFLDLLGITVSLGVLSFLLGLAALIISLYITYKIITGVKDMEETYRTHLNSDSLKAAWNVLTVSTLFAFLLVLIPALSILCFILSLIAAIWFLAAFHRSKTLYYNIGPR